MDWRTVNERENDLSLLTSLNALIVTDWDKTNWEGVPDIIPFEGLKDKPIGRDPEVIENEGSYPSTVGEIENGSFLFRTYVESGYENEVMDWRTVNERENDLSLLTSFEALIVTDWDKTNSEGIPEMTPVEGLRDKPVGRDPDEVENDKSSPSIEGEIENGSYLDRVYVELG